MSATSRTLIGILGLAVVGSTIVVATNAAHDPYGNLQPFLEVRTLIEQAYVEDPDDDTLLGGAIDGMLAVLDDPYTEFVPVAETAAFERSLTGEYAGIGAEVGIRDGWFTILSPLDDSPAWRAGVQADDRVVAIDGASTEGLGVDDAIALLLGPAGTTVNITVERNGAEPIGIAIERGQIKVVPVRGLVRTDAGEGAWRFLLDPETGIAYIRLSQFTPGSAEALRAAIGQAVGEWAAFKSPDAIGRPTPPEAPGGLILDLRFNPGGVLEEAVAIADLFLPEGVIVSTQARTGDAGVSRARAAGTLSDFPVVVLVNAQSASASEIVAGALGDNGRAVVLGTRTFGKGLVQTIRPLPSGAGVLKMTEQRYALPSGRIIQRSDDSAVWGVDPSPGFYLPLTDEETGAMLTARREQEIIAHHDDPDPVTPDEILARLADPQLAAALAVLRHRVATGRTEPIGIPPNDPDFLATGELSTVLRQRDLLVRELTRVERRIEAAREATPDAAAEPRDLWPDDRDPVGGSVVVTDAQGNTIATLTVTGPDLERWLIDAGVVPTEPGQSDPGQPEPAPSSESDAAP